MHHKYTGEPEADGNAGAKPKIVWREAVGLIIHKFVAASVLEKVLSLLWLAAITTLGEIYFAWVWNNVDKPKIVIVLIASAITLCVWVGAIRLIGIFGSGTPPSTAPALAIVDTAPKFTGVLASKTILSARGGVIPKIEIGQSGAIIEGDAARQLVALFKDIDLMIESDSGLVKVSTTLLDQTGNVIAQISRNEWGVAGRPISWDRNYNQNSLEVKDNGGKVILQVIVLADRIQLQAIWTKRNGHKAVIMQSNGTKVGREFGQFSLDVSQEDFQNEIKSFEIVPMFNYPSETHLGELANALPTTRDPPFIPMPASNRKPAQILQPMAILHLGGPAFVINVDPAGNSAPWNHIVVNGVRPVEFVVKNKILYFSGILPGGPLVDAVTIKEGNPVTLPIGWDMNQDAGAMEIVDSTGMAIFQALYTTDLDVTVRGVFGSVQKGVIIAKTEETKVIPVPTPDEVSTRFPPIFRYPSRSHPGERAPATSTSTNPQK